MDGQSEKAGRMKASQLQQLEEVRQATGDSFSELWLKNFQANLPLLQENPGVALLGRNRSFVDIPAILVGAGPSLDKQLPFLYQRRNNALFIVCDAALRPLLQAGITPHIVVTLDPQEEIIRFFSGLQTSSSLLIAPSIVHPSVVKVWDGEILFFHKLAPEIPALVEVARLLPHLATLVPGGSVLSVGYDLAFKIGCAPLVFVGQDLSYTGKNSHAGTSMNAHIESSELIMRMQRHIVEETDIFGKNVLTSKSLSTSKDWFHWIFQENRKHRVCKTVNASESGIIREACEVLSLRDVMRDMMHPPVPAVRKRLAETLKGMKKKASLL